MNELVLASTSAARRRLLANAGLDFTAVAPAVDEASMKAEMRAQSASSSEAAVVLARMKAIEVSRRHPQALVIGADQLLDRAGAWYDKPVDRAAAGEQLASLRGRDHRLLTAVAVARSGALLWSHLDIAEMRVRDFSEPFLDDYLDRAGESVYSSVGAYQLEGIGVQLFESVTGDFFAILGLPLVPLLNFLRSVGAIPS